MLMKKSPNCFSSLANSSPQWKVKVFCSVSCRKAHHRKSLTENARAYSNKSKIIQNDAFLRIIKECRRGRTVQILSGQTIVTLRETILLLEDKPPGDLVLCHIAPVRGDGCTGLFHPLNLFYGGRFQNAKFGKRYLSGGIYIENRCLEHRWCVTQRMINNDILLMIERYLGDVISEYLKSTR